MKLLHKTLQVYLIFSILIFIISVPIFYMVIQSLWIQDVDESLIFQKEKFLKGVKATKLDSASISEFSELVSELDLGIHVVANPEPFRMKDSIYYHSYYDSTHAHVEPFRELSSWIYINQKPYKITVRKDLVENADLIRGIIYTQAILFLVFLTGVVILNNYLSQKIWKPFYQIVTLLKSFDINRGSPILLKKSHILEFNELNTSVERLTENNIRVYNAQKEFTENAAHETQTPLAVIKNQLDLLAQTSALSFKQSEIISRIDKNIRLLTKLNRNLLLLSKIENHQFNNADKVNLKISLTEITETFEEQIKLKGLKLKTDFQNSPDINSNSFLINLLFINLLNNAIRYNIDNGLITIKLTEFAFEIWNTGNNEALPEDKIYRRFYKISGQADSSGLGLAIAKQICELLSFTLEYSFVQKNEHHFKVGFRN